MPWTILFTNFSKHYCQCQRKNSTLFDDNINTSILILCINSLNLDKIYLKNINNEQHIYMPTTLQAIAFKINAKLRWWFS